MVAHQDVYGRRLHGDVDGVQVCPLDVLHALDVDVKDADLVLALNGLHRTFTGDRAKRGGGQSIQPRQWGFGVSPSSSKSSPHRAPLCPDCGRREERACSALAKQFLFPQVSSGSLGWSRDLLSPAREAGKTMMEGVEMDNVRLCHEHCGSGTVRKAPAFDKHRSNLHQRAKTLRTLLLQTSTDFCTCALS